MKNTPPYLDPQRPITERVADLMSRMTLEEKVGQMCQYLLPEDAFRATPRTGSSSCGQPAEDIVADSDDSTMRYDAEERKSVAAMIAKGQIGSILSVTDPVLVNQAQALTEESRLKIPLLFGIDAIHGNAMHAGATVFPAPIGLAASWDTDLVRRVARATAEEVRSCNLHWTFSPNVDVLRDGRWGRAGETFGEDPYLVGQMGIAMTEGYQTADETDTYVMACAKHYIAGGEPNNGLNFAAMDMSERSLREVYLPPFADAVTAGVDTVMAAHNEVNGVPCHGNHYLLTEILREQLGFEGFIVSDFTDISRLFTLHKVATSIQDADRQAVEAGIDMHMHGPGFLDEVIDLVEGGILAQDQVDRAVSKILDAKFRVGLFENRYVDVDPQTTGLSTTAHQALALESARKSIVLLKNERALLPINPEIRRIFVTGPNANSQALLGDWAMEQPEDNVVTVLRGVRRATGYHTAVDFLDCGSLLSISEDAIRAAAQQATVADVAVVVVGENPLRTAPDKTEGENVPRSSLALPGKQHELVEAVIRSGTPTVVVLINGRPQAIPWIADHAAAIVEAFHPGMQGGQAIADVLFGATNPGGRLPYTVPRSVGQIRAIYNHRPGDYFRSYQDIPNAPLYPFGFGLSYTTFTYADLVAPKSVQTGDDIEVKVTVANTGARSGDEVVIVTLHDRYASVTRPVQEVVAFQRVTLAAGESTTVHFVIEARQMSLYNRNMMRVIEPGAFGMTVGTLHTTIEVLGEEPYALP